MTRSSLDVVGCVIHHLDTQWYHQSGTTHVFNRGICLQHNVHVHYAMQFLVYSDIPRYSFCLSDQDTNTDTCTHTHTLSFIHTYTLLDEGPVRHSTAVLWLIGSTQWPHTITQKEERPPASIFIILIYIHHFINSYSSVVTQHILESSVCMSIDHNLMRRLWNSGSTSKSAPIWSILNFIWPLMSNILTLQETSLNGTCWLL